MSELEEYDDFYAEQLELPDVSADLTHLPLWTWGAGPGRAAHCRQATLAAIKAVAEEHIAAKVLARYPGAFGGIVQHAVGVADLLASESDDVITRASAIALLAATHGQAGSSARRIAGGIVCLAAALHEDLPRSPEGATAAMGAAMWLQAAAYRGDLAETLHIHVPDAHSEDTTAINYFCDELLRAAMGGHYAHLSRYGTVAVIEVPSADWISPIRDAIASASGHGPHVFADGDSQGQWQGPRRRVITFCRDGSNPKLGPDTGNGFVACTVTGGGAVIGISHAPDLYLPRALLKGADRRLVLKPPSSRQVTAALRRFHGGRAPKASVPAEICSIMTALDVQLACRHGEGPERAVRRFIELASRGKVLSRGPTLEGLTGMDEARDWGLRLARDLEAYRRGEISWQEVDPGVLLAGEPGTGKSTFASRLAAHCGVPLVVGSYSIWQSSGEAHLGTMLRAMREAFAKAYANTPSILFIDEIDNFVPRSESRGHHTDYMAAVVNGLLELLAGAQSREGVIVIGATNLPDRVDPALRRSGRLDRTITIPLPNPTDLEKILRTVLREDLGDQDLAPLMASTAGSTGADCERWCREARRLARSQGRPLSLEDLATAIGDLPELTDREARICAVHEAGHAVAAAILLPSGSVKTVRVGGTAAGGLTSMMLSGDGVRRRDDWLDVLRVLLAGRAAEELLLGAASDGSGGSQESDLARATHIATAVETSFGLGSQLTWSNPYDAPQSMTLLANRDVAARVEAVLEEAMADVQDLLRRHMSLLSTVADRLLALRRMDGDELQRLVDEHLGGLIAVTAAAVLE